MIILRHDFRLGNAERRPFCGEKIESLTTVMWNARHNHPFTVKNALIVATVDGCSFARDMLRGAGDFSMTIDNDISCGVLYGVSAYLPTPSYFPFLGVFRFRKEAQILRNFENHWKD